MIQYQIYNDGANLRFDADGSILIVAKSEIEEVTLVREDIIHISTGPCEKGIHFRSSQVSFPGHDNADHLIEILDDWLGGHVDIPVR